MSGDSSLLWQASQLQTLAEQNKKLQAENEVNNDEVAITLLVALT